MAESEMIRYQARLNTLRVERNVREVAPEVLIVRGQATELQPPGSICITVAPADSDILRRLSEAAASTDAATIEETLGPIKRMLSERRQIPLDMLSRVIENTNSFVDVSYGCRQLIRTVFVVDDVPVSRAILPFVGGSIDPQNFKVIEYFSSDEDRGLDVLITVHEPEIDTDVVAILDRLPEEDALVRLGITPDAVACTATATPVVVAVTVAIVATAVGRCAPAWNSKEWVINPAIELNELAPTLSVQRLIALRENLLATPVV